MPRPTLRALAKEAGLSVATISMALRDDPRLRPETITRVKALASALGYRADPVMAEAMSRARRKDFYRETIGWLMDRPPEEQPWVAGLFAGAEERARRFGYRIEYFAADLEDATVLRRMVRMWRARGVRGVVLGPLRKELVDPPLPWDDFCWVTIGHSLVSPALHRVGRDYDKDIGWALSRLHAQGCRRPGFVDDAEVHHLMRLPLLRAALLYYHARGQVLPDAFHTLDMRRPEAFARWLKTNRPDSLVMGIGFENRAEAIHRQIAHLPQVELSPPYLDGNRAGFVPSYASMGASAVGMLHRALTTGETGVPANERTMIVSSTWREG